MSKKKNAIDPTLPKLALSEINLGRQVGLGGFSTVKEIKSVDLDEIYDTSDLGSKFRSQFAATVRNGGKYVLKTLRHDLPEDEHDKAVMDLAIEAAFLQVLEHPHIIRMRAASQSDPCVARFFVILDRLTMTLERKFNLWRRIVGENTGYWVPCYGYCCSKNAVLHVNWKDRLQTAADIATAIEYLHRQGIIYRDLKPDNIGFDASGTLKVFDFGLAKRVEDAEQVDENYLLTGNTGSLRYMAPEVAKDEPYNFSADCYSFGVLFWQICSLTTPYAGLSQAAHALQVIHGNHRPKPDKSWPMSWTQLMTCAWSPRARERRSSTEVASELEQMVAELTEEDGVVPSRASEIRARKKRKKVSRDNQVLDRDTRIASTEIVGVKNHHGGIV